MLDVPAVLIGGVSESSGGRAAHVGATALELVIAETKLFGRPPDIRRFPLDKVKIVKSSEGMVTDEIVLEVGEPKKMSAAARKETRVHSAIDRHPRWRSGVGRAGCRR